MVLLEDCKFFHYSEIFLCLNRANRVIYEPRIKREFCQLIKYGYATLPSKRTFQLERSDRKMGEIAQSVTSCELSQG